ncbi:hypothetical protein Q7P37_010327 [Cladosporium fusiforme]
MADEVDADLDFVAASSPELALTSLVEVTLGGATGVRQGTKRAAARPVADRRLCPASVLERNAGVGAGVLHELAARPGGGITVTTGLFGVIVPNGAVFASSLSLLLGCFLLLDVCIANLGLVVLDGVVVEALNDLFTSFTTL